MGNGESPSGSPTWAELPVRTRELLKGKLAGLWGALNDAEAFDSWPLDKKQGMLLLLPGPSRSAISGKTGGMKQ